MVASQEVPLRAIDSLGSSNLSVASAVIWDPPVVRFAGICFCDLWGNGIPQLWESEAFSIIGVYLNYVDMVRGVQHI